MATREPYSRTYKGDRNARVVFPLGGIGAGMMGLEGTGALSHVSLRNAPDTMNEPVVFSAICVKGEEGNIARVLEGQVPRWKVFSNRAEGYQGAWSGLSGKHYGLPRFAESAFSARFPFGTVKLRDPGVPVDAELTGWSPFVPLNADDSSLPAAALEYTLTNRTAKPVELVYSFHAAQFMAAQGTENHRVVRSGTRTGFVLDQPAVEHQPWVRGAFSATIDYPGATVDCAWFRGGWFDPMTMVWKSVEEGAVIEREPLTEGKPSPGASLYVPIVLQPRESQTIRVLLSWYVPDTNLTVGTPAEAPKTPQYHRPWYAGRFGDMDEAAVYWADHYTRLREESAKFSDAFYGTTMPEAVVDAVAANLSILKSPTVLRQTDGRLWGWEGSQDTAGSCHGTCTHVWNYAQAVPHLFPELERGVRQTEFEEGQDEAGHQNFRVPLPIQSADHDFHAASDGQLGGIMKTYRDWKISGDSSWLRRLWPKTKQSLNYCIDVWDPDRTGVLVEPHHNTYDIEFWGPDGMCSSIYLGALKAASLMAQALGEDAAEYDELYRRGRAFMEKELFNGEYFEQRIVWEGLRTPSPTSGLQAWNVDYSQEAIDLLQREGPKYQYGQGCLSDGVIGAWMAEVCGIGEILDRDKVKSHLLSVYKYNLKRDLTGHANPQRPGFALGEDGGLLLCTWPRGGKLSLPFVYSNEVWTGIEYQVASHLLSLGCVEEGLDIVSVCRSRYDGATRNPFNEYECGHWYARAMASYALIQGWSGIRYDACDKTLHISPRVAGDFSSFLCTASGYGIAGIRGGRPFVEAASGHIAVERINLV